MPEVRTDQVTELLQQWYQKGVDVGEPNSLARFAERDETSAVAEADESRRNALLLQAFSRYAAAAEYAHKDDWPDDAWKNWRYRHATLARLLVREVLMQQVGDAYSTVLEQRLSERAWWEQIKQRCTCESEPDLFSRSSVDR